MIVTNELAWCREQASHVQSLKIFIKNNIGTLCRPYRWECKTCKEYHSVNPLPHYIICNTTLSRVHTHTHTHLQSFELIYNNFLTNGAHRLAVRLRPPITPETPLGMRRAIFKKINLAHQVVQQSFTYQAQAWAFVPMYAACVIPPLPGSQLISI